MDGDGQSTKETKLDLTYGSKEACAAAVKSLNHDANGATFSTGDDGSCYAEFGQYDISVNDNWINCKFAESVCTLAYYKRLHIFYNSSTKNSNEQAAINNCMVFNYVLCLKS